MSRNAPSHDSYATVALQYYLAARFAALAGLIPVSANLMHHAFEFILKAAVIHDSAVPGGPNASVVKASSRWRRFLSWLCGRPIRDIQTVEEFLKYRYGHRLSRIWNDFRKTTSSDLSRFDTAIQSLDRWEEIRYPGRGAAMTIDFFNNTAPPTGSAMRGVSVYSMDVSVLDECFHELWVACSLSQSSLTNSILVSRPLAKDAYEKWNTHHF